MSRREHILPQGITQVAWLQSSGNAITGEGQWINTNISTYYLETEIKFREVENAQATGNLQLVCGCWNTANNRYYVAQHGSSAQGNYDLYTSNKSNTIYKIADHNLNIDHVVIYNNSSNKVLCDGVQKASISNITVNNLTYKVILFGGGTSTFSSGVVPSSWRIYYAKFRNKYTNTYVGDFVPVLDSSGVPAMFDNVTQQLFYNSGSGQFSYGLV